MNNDYILMFVDYLIIPLIALGIDMRRSGKKQAFSIEVAASYASYATVVVIIVYVVRVVMSRLGIGMDTDPGTGLYTVFATAVALILPYIKEMIATYINVRCEIKGKKVNSSDER